MLYRWTDNMILRFLCANNFKMNKTLISIQEHTVWRETTLPVKVDEQLQKVLVCISIAFFILLFERILV